MASNEEESRAPLQGNYPMTVIFVLLALCPDLFLSTAIPLTRMTISRDLHAPLAAIQLGETFSNAGWAFGAVLAADLAQRFPSYRLNVLYEFVFVVGSICGAVAPAIPFVVAGRILQGFATGMLLISALPPLIRNFNIRKLGPTAAFTDMALFGAVAAGPIVGGYVAASGTWRWFFAATALLALCGLMLAMLVVNRQPGFNPDFKLDTPAIALAAAGAGLTFYGVGELIETSWTQPIVWIPTALGMFCLVVLIMYQYRHEGALMPVKPLSTTYPLVGIPAGILGGAAFTGLLEVLFLFLEDVRGLKPLGIGLVLWPALAATIVASVLFGKLFTTRYVLLLPLMGMLSLLAAAWLLTTTTTATGTGEIEWIAGFLGLGAGLTVSPGLFIAGLSVRPALIGRAFALVELLRLAGAFALVPAFVYFATIFGPKPESIILGSHIVYWVILCGLALTVAGITAVFFLGGARVHPPDTVAYIEQGEVAFDSPPFAAAPDLGEAISTGILSVFEEQSPGRREEREREERARREQEAENERQRGRQPAAQ